MFEERGQKKVYFWISFENAPTRPTMTAVNPHPHNPSPPLHLLSPQHPTQTIQSTIFTKTDQKGSFAFRDSPILQAHEHDIHFLGVKGRKEAADELTHDSLKNEILKFVPKIRTEPILPHRRGFLSWLNFIFKSGNTNIFIYLTP